MKGFLFIHMKALILKWLALAWLSAVEARKKVKKPKRTIQATANLPPSGAPQKIPKIFHNIWFDFGKGEEVLPHYGNNMRELQLLHPDWDFMLGRRTMS